VERADASELLRREGLRPSRRESKLALVLELRAGSLSNGDYVALVEDEDAAVGSETVPVEEFFFRVLR
jgi:hypothetical protein